MLKECKRHGMTEFALRSKKERKHWKCRKCETLYVKERRNRIKEKLVEIHGGKCMKCGYNKCLRAMTFHHRDPSQKELSLSKDALLGWERVLQESYKCDLLCHNCHMEVHDELEKMGC
jgi:hypothetical protein